MKRYVLTILLASMILPIGALGEEWGEEQMPIEQAEQQFELRNMQLEMEKHESELRFHEEMQELELELRRVEIERQRAEFSHRSHGKRCPHAILLICILVVHILAAVWVYKDIGQRKCGSGLWIWITILAGLLGALVYAVTRIGDNGQTKSRTK